MKRLSNNVDYTLECNCNFKSSITSKDTPTTLCTDIWRRVKDTNAEKKAWLC